MTTIRTICLNCSATAIVAVLFHPAPSFAQQPPAPPEPAHKTKVLVGCLLAGPDASTFRLTKASERQPADGAGSQPGAVATSGSAADYVLEPEAKTDSAVKTQLATHIGRRVEITARPVEAPPEAPLGRGEPGRGELVSPEPKPEEPKVERLTVTAVTPLSQSCS